MRHAAAVRGNLAEQQAHQRGLARAVRPDDADPVTAQDTQVEGPGDHQRTACGLIGL